MGRPAAARRVQQLVELALRRRVQCEDMIEFIDQSQRALESVPGAQRKATGAALETGSSPLPAGRDDEHAPARRDERPERPEQPVAASITDETATVRSRPWAVRERLAE